MRAVTVGALGWGTSPPCRGLANTSPEEHVRVDQLNNGLLGENAADSTCTDYEQVMPPAKQPPKHKDMPNAHRPPKPANPTPVPEPDTETCGARVNTYNVESPTSSPFYGIKFEFASGTQVKDTDYDIFEFTLTAEQAAAMGSVQIEAKAGGDAAIGSVALENCQFDEAIPCGDMPMDGNDYFAFYFMGAEDNGDNTYTLTFQVQNMTAHGLSHVTIGLPDGAVPSSPGGSYQSEVCPE